jgi:Protein of unknown function (DUF3300)
MNTLAKLLATLFVPVLTMCSTAQTQTYPQSNTPSASYANEFSRAELDQLLAPIALYPDTVLSHVLIASTYPLEVVQADRFARENAHLGAEAAVDAASNRGWDPSVTALVAFPQILQRMSEDLDWTQRLGDAFLADEVAVMDVIQNLREKAYASGSLNKMKHVSVERDNRIIIIEPAVERVVYIPTYDTRVVYGSWWWPDYPPVYWHHPHNHVYVSGFYWGPRATLGLGFYSTSFHWHQRRVVYIDRHHHHNYSRRIPRPYTSRNIAHYEGAKHWRHDPVHRRGLAYRSERIGERYGSQRPSIRQVQEQRDHSRRLVGQGRSSERSSIEAKRFDNGRRLDSPSRDIQRSDANARQYRNQDRAAEVRQRLNRDDSATRSHTGGSTYERNTAAGASGRRELPVTPNSRINRTESRSVESAVGRVRNEDSRSYRGQLERSTPVPRTQVDRGTRVQRFDPGSASSSPSRESVSSAPERISRPLPSPSVAPQAAPQRRDEPRPDSSRSVVNERRIEAPRSQRIERDSGGGRSGGGRNGGERIERR